MSWKKPGDPCPICGSIDTDLHDFQDAQWVKDVNAPSGRRMTEDSQYSMVCNNCTNLDRIGGNPFRGEDPDAEDDAAPVTNPDVELAKVAAEEEAAGIDPGPPRQSFYGPRMMLKELHINVRYLRKNPGGFYAVWVGADEYKDANVTDLLDQYTEWKLTPEKVVAEIRGRLGK